MLDAYPQREEIDAVIREAYAALFDTLQTKETEHGVALFTKPRRRAKDMAKLHPMLTLQELKSSTWESLPQHGPEWLESVLESKEAWESMLGNPLTPQQVFNAEFDKDPRAEIEEQE